MTKEEGLEQKKRHELHDEMQEKAEIFSKRFANASYESGQAQQFMRNFCEVFGIDTYSSIQFEERVRKDDDTGINRIDGFLPGMLLIEMKSSGKDLTKAAEQAFEYVRKLEKERKSDVPPYVLVSDFQNLHLYESGSEAVPIAEIKLAEFSDHLETFSFLSGYRYIVERRQEEVNIKAAEKLADLHESIKRTGYGGKDLETLLVRILFCLFAEDTGLFGEPDQFTKLINDTHPHGRDLSGALDLLFISLDAAQRPETMYDSLRGFPYVNGELFKGRLAPCYFTPEARSALLACAADIDWSQISPAIFGSLFQAIMHFDDNDDKAKSKKRREFGAHYTSEKNILKTIEPLFLDKLRKELKECKGEVAKLEAYRKKLQQLRIFDPACGCGNFLVVAYREIRMLEEQALKQLANPKKGQAALFENPLCNVSQCYGIEIDSSAAQIATVALWLVDHQMNMRFETIDKTPYRRLPLTEKANIVCGNALQLDWNSMLPAKECSYVMGNPPFVGHQWRTSQQVEDMERVWGKDGRFGRLDYVTCWHNKATAYMKSNPKIRTALVSTNSICQGEQVGTLWEYLLAQGVQIHFAHRTFQWSNEGKGVAAVHCVIVGFGLENVNSRIIFEYENIKSEPRSVKVSNINPYLVDAPNVILPSRTKTPEGLPQIKQGSKPVDNGNFLFSKEQKNEFISIEPAATKWLKLYVGSDELINGIQRWCLWLKGIDSEELKKLPEVLKRVKAVAESRKKSPTLSVREFADKPTLFTQDRQPDSNYLAVPEVSSENRKFIPIVFLSSDTVASNKLLTCQGATNYHFGILSSTMHNAWMRAVCGRLESRYSYAPSVYNNYPWPENAAEEKRQAVADKAQKVLDVRKNHVGQTLAWMYNPETMPNDLKKAHAELDAAVDAAYGYTGKADDAARVAFLFKLYGELVAEGR